MTIQRIPIVSREQWLAAREQDVTASAAGALLGVHEYQTPYGLWALKSGRVDDDPGDSPAMQRGRLLEPVAIQLIREQNPHWKIIEGNDAYYRDPDIRLGCTPDLIVECPERGRGVIQIKSVGSMIFRKKWQDGDHNIVPPTWIGIQAMIEANLVDAQWACVAPMVVDYGVDIYMIDTPLIPALFDRIKSETVKFWKVIKDGIEPDPDFSQDEETIGKMFSGLDPCIIDLTADNALGQDVDRIRGFKKVAREAEAEAKTLTNEIKHKVIKAAETAGIPLGANDEKPRISMPDGRTIGWVAYTRKPYQVGAADVSYLRMPTKD